MRKIFENDRNEIESCLRRFFADGDVFEVRALDAVTRGAGGYRTQPHVESGYFDYAHIGCVADELSKYASYKGVYFTMNPVRHELISRAANRMRNPRKDPLTSDADIITRRWILIDCDARRPSGIPSSDDEHDKAIALSDEIASGMMSRWGEPVKVDSGNGAQLFWKISVPADDKGFVQSILRSFATGSTDSVDIDISVFNPARIVRLPGTWNVKGDEFDDRHHRMAVTRSVPSDMRVLEFTQLNSAVIHEMQDIEERDFHMERGFDLQSWIDEHCTGISAPKPYYGGSKWVFDVCPFNPDHRDRSAVIVQRGNGAIGFRCHHNGCAGKTWHDLRELLEGHAGDSDDTGDVDLSSLIRSKAKVDISSDAFDGFDERRECMSLPFDESLYDVGGIVSEYLSAAMTYAPVPNRPLAFSGAMAMMSFIVGRKVCSYDGIFPNVYVVSLAKSGTGKNFPVMMNKRIMLDAFPNACVADTFASGAGIEDALAIDPNVLFMPDEMHFLLTEMSGEANGRSDRISPIAPYMLRLYTSSGTSFKTRMRAGGESSVIRNPNFVMLGSSIPAEFFESMSERFLSNGMFSRMSIFVGDDPKEPDYDRIQPALDIPVHLLSRISEWASYVPDGGGNMDFSPRIMEFDDGARLVARDVKRMQYERSMEFSESLSDDWKMSLWNRYYEIAVKYAIICACSRMPPGSARIDEEAMRWGADIVRWDIENKIRMAGEFMSQSRFDRDCKYVLNVVKSYVRKNREEIGVGELAYRCRRFDNAYMTTILSSLMRQGRMRQAASDGGGMKYLPIWQRKTE